MSAQPSHSSEPARARRTPKSKDRWSAAKKRARNAGPARSNDRSGRPARFEREDRPARFERAERSDRQRSGRPSRFERDDRPARSERSDRNERRDRPRFDRDDRPSRYGRDDRPRNDRQDRRDRPRFERDDRPARSDRNDRPRFDRDERPRHDRDDRGGRPARYSRDDRPRNDRSRNDRPARFDRDDRPRNDRPRNERPARFDRDDRPRNDRPRNDRPRNDRPARFDRDDRPRSAEPRRDHHAEAVVHAPLEAVEVAADEVAHLGFAELGLEGNLIDALAKLGAEHPFPIQAVTVPEVLAGRDVLGRGRTGSGKTIAFGAPLVQRIAQSTTQPKGKGGKTYGRKPRALILAPTRELAQQIDRTVQPLARAAGLYTVQIFGGVRQFKQVSALQRGVDIVIGTPGRIEDLIEQGHLDLSEVEITVLDEADLMSEFGFLEPVQRIWRGCRPDGQRLLFSATLDKQVDDLVTEFLREPFIAKMADEDQSTATIEHHVLVVEQRDKGEVLLELASVPGPILVFARTRAYAERLADDLEDAGIKATSLHGNLTQARRTQNLAKLSSGRKQVLVATDVAARGIHLDDISLVVQADMPDDPKTYLHRAGRTGRAGRSGRVVTLIPRNRRRKLAHMLQTAEVSAEMTPVEPGGAVIWE